MTLCGSESDTPNEVDFAAVLRLQRQMRDLVEERNSALSPQALRRLALRVASSPGRTCDTLRMWVEGGPSGKPVDAAAMRAFIDSVPDVPKEKGVFVALGSFTADALSLAGRTRGRVRTLDGGQLADRMIRRGVGVHRLLRLELVQIDENFYKDLELKIDHRKS